MPLFTPEVTIIHRFHSTPTHSVTCPFLLLLDEEEIQKSKHIVESTKVLLRDDKSDDSTDEEVLYEQTQL